MKKPGVVLLVIVFVTGFAVLLAPRLLQIKALRERSDNLEAELRKLRVQNQTLENELRLLRDDPVYLEKVARQQFNKAKEGEIVYKVVRQGDRAETERSQS